MKHNDIGYRYYVDATDIQDLYVHLGPEVHMILHQHKDEHVIQTVCMHIITYLLDLVY